MKDLVARLIAYLFAGSFCVAGPLFLVVALGSAGQRAALIYSGQHAQGTVIAKRPTGSSHVTYAPVFQFTAGDGRVYTVTSDVYGAESAFGYGEGVPVLYQPSHPDAARIDAFAQLWTFPLVVGVVGAGFSIIPAFVLAQWLRRRRQPGGEQPGNAQPAQGMTGTGSRGLHRALGLLLTAGGLFLLAVGLGLVSSDSTSLREQRVFVTDLGVLLAASGLAVGQWVATGSRLYHALGGLVVTSMAVMFGWIALYGESAGFSGGVSVGGAAVTSSGSVTPARIAFGIASIGVGLVSLWAWKQVFRPRG